MRLETFGFRQVYDYEGGKLDWLAHGLPRGGQQAETPNAGEIARRDVPTCRRDERIGAIWQRVRPTGWTTCLVVDDEDRVIGRLSPATLTGDPTPTADAVLAPGPSTFRPSLPVAELADYVKQHPLDLAIITTPEGRLIGAIPRADLELPNRTNGRLGRQSSAWPATEIAFGYKLSAEEHAPRDLIRQAQRAEAAGFAFAAISDHFHPWVDRQGQSAFVWSILGAIAAATDRIEVGTAVTCPTLRLHPAIVAQAAATTAALLPGRFFLGLGSGENLNEHILGDRWPPPAERLERLAEAIEIIRLLWQGRQRTYRGRYYTVDHARLYTLPETPPPIYLAAGGPIAARLAGRIADGLIGTQPNPDILGAFAAAGGAGRPRLGEVALCWAADEAAARRTARDWWPIARLGGKLLSDLPTPAHFEQAADPLTPDDIAAEVPCGPDPERHLAAIRRYVEAGYDRIWLHQIGPDQDGFCQFFERELAPRLARLGAPSLAHA